MVIGILTNVLPRYHKSIVISIIICTDAKFGIINIIFPQKTKDCCLQGLKSEDLPLKNALDFPVIESFRQSMDNIVPDLKLYDAGND